MESQPESSAGSMIRPSNPWQCGVEHAVLSDIGMRRSSNQDAYAVVLAENLEAWRRRGHLFTVADGMGAHAAGELASRLAVDHVLHNYQKLTDFKPPVAIRRSISEANRMIHSRGQANIEFMGMGTTCSTLLLLPEGALVAHVGDSRVYRLRNSRLEQLTFDHSLIWEMMAASRASERELAETVPKNVITRSLGPNPSVEIDLEGPFPIEQGDRFLLCSDGLCGLVDDEEIGLILSHFPLPRAAEMLVDLANLRGGGDNITLIAIEAEGPPVAAPRMASNASGDARRSVHPWFGAAVAVAAFLLAAAAAVAGAARQWVAAALVSGLVASIAALWGVRRRGPARPRQAAEWGPFGRGPHRATAAQLTRVFVDSMQRLFAHLRSVIPADQWDVDWEKIEEEGRAAMRDVSQGKDNQAMQRMADVAALLAERLRARRDPWLRRSDLDLA